jgi:hypothetical protein
MPTVQRELRTRAMQRQLNFPVEHQFKILVQYAVTLGLVIFLVILVVLLLGPRP